MNQWGYGPIPRTVCGSVDVNLISELVEDQVILFTTESLLSSLTVQALQDKLKIDNSSIFLVTPNPSLFEIESKVEQFHRKHVSAIIGFGGGSVLDTAKVASLLMTSENVSSLKETTIKSLKQREVKLILIPTTAGTGAEVTPFATIWNDTESGKESIEHLAMIPDLIFLDPTLLLSLSDEQLLYPALDSLSHAVETLWNKYQTPFSSLMAGKALSLSISALPRIISGDRSLPSLSDLLLAANFAGLAISESHTAISHSISYPLTRHFSMPHGLASSFAIPGICAQMSREDWKKTSNSSLIQEAARLLESIPVKNEVHKFVSTEECLSLVPLMLNKTRSNNFVGEFSIDDVVASLKYVFS